jgi:hypothetical protein
MQTNSFSRALGATDCQFVSGVLTLLLLLFRFVACFAVCLQELPDGLFTTAGPALTALQRLTLQLPSPESLPPRRLL